MSELVPPRPDARRLETLPAWSPAARPSRSRGSTWGPWPALGVYVLSWLVGTIATVPVFLLIGDRGVAEVVASAVVAMINVAVLLIWLSRRHPGWAAAIGFPDRPAREVGIGVGVGVLLYPAIIVIGVVLTMLFRDIVGRAVSTPDQVPGRLPAFGIVVTALYAIVIAPIHEELFFRGILFRSLRDRYGFLVGAVASAVAFGLVHYVPARSAANSLLLMSIMFFTGFALARLYEWRGNIVASMIAHATFNTIGVVLIFVVR